MKYLVFATSAVVLLLIGGQLTTQHSWPDALYLLGLLFIGIGGVTVGAIARKASSWK